MKKVLAWTFRILCFLVIFAAAFTLGRSLLHVNDDHSYEAVMADAAVPTFESKPVEENPVAENETVVAVEENPTLTLDCADSVSAYQPYVTLSAVFSNIQYSIVAELDWYVDGELVSQQTDRILVEGASVSCTAKVADENSVKESADVRLEVLFDDKTLEASSTIMLEYTDGNAEIIRTEEIAVTILNDCDGWEDQQLTSKLCQLSAGDTGLLLGYENEDDGTKVLRLQMDNGTYAWVDAANAEITDEACTTDEDYSTAAKEEFVNDMGYDSHTDYLVWVNLYTQKVNVFTGYQNQWTLLKSFDCATGVNQTPTTTGTFTYNDLQDKWDLGDIYVEPVMVFNGGEAFTSLPYKTSDHTISDDTIGKPASGGSVRLQEEDIQWMADTLPIDTLVVVY